MLLRMPKDATRLMEESFEVRIGETRYHLARGEVANLLEDVTRIMFFRYGLTEDDMNITLGRCAHFLANLNRASLHAPTLNPTEPEEMTDEAA